MPMTTEDESTEQLPNVCEVCWSEIDGDPFVVDGVAMCVLCYERIEVICNTSVCSAGSKQRQ